MRRRLILHETGFPRSQFFPSYFISLCTDVPAPLWGREASVHRLHFIDGREFVKIITFIAYSTISSWIDWVLMYIYTKTEPLVVLVACKLGCPIFLFIKFLVSALTSCSWRHEAFCYFQARQKGYLLFNRGLRSNLKSSEVVLVSRQFDPSVFPVTG